MLLSDFQVTLFLFVFVVVSFVEIWFCYNWFVRIRFIDYLLKMFNLVEKEAAGRAKKCS